ncbi:hypothetical protein NBRC116492_35350 [Aurantivibrio infirmus]
MNIDRSQFLKELKGRYPEIKDELNSQEGLITFEVSVFLQLVQRNIDDGNRDGFQQSIELVNRFYSEGNKALRSSICNGVCEDLLFEDSKKNNRSWALALLPEPLAKERDSWRKFIGGSKNA